MQFWPMRHEENMKKRSALISQSDIWILHDHVIFRTTAPNYSHEGHKQE